VTQAAPGAGGRHESCTNYQDKTKDGEESRFFKLVSQDTAHKK
jgi:hypothetical protein